MVETPYIWSRISSKSFISFRGHSTRLCKLHNSPWQVAVAFLHWKDMWANHSKVDIILQTPAVLLHLSWWAKDVWRNCNTALPSLWNRQVVHEIRTKIITFRTIDEVLHPQWGRRLPISRFFIMLDSRSIYLDERLFISPCCASWSFTTDTGKDVHVQYVSGAYSPSY